MARNFDEEIEIMEGFYQADQEKMNTAYRNRGVPDDVRDRVLARLIEDWDCVERWEREIQYLTEEGINHPFHIIIDVGLMNGLTIDEIAEHVENTNNYTPLPAVQAQG